MKLDDVLKLIDAGFSKEEIMRYDNNVEVAPIGETEQPTRLDSSDKSIPNDSKEIAEPLTDGDNQTSTNKGLEELRAEMNKLKNAVQHNAIMDSEMPAKKEETLVDIMNKIIN